MSRAISESLELLSETLGNCKTNLKEKEVADVDNIKISDVDEKIAEIQAGGGGGFNFIENVTVKEDYGEYKPLTGSVTKNNVSIEGVVFDHTYKFTTKEEICLLLKQKQDITLTITPNPESTSGNGYTAYTLSNSQTYSVQIKSNGSIEYGYHILLKKSPYNDRLSLADAFIYDVF